VATPHGPPTTSRPRILVVEPSRALRETECEILIRGDSIGTFYPCPAATLAHALLQLDACQPHAVVTTFTLPDGTGVELVEELRRRGSYLTIVAVTGRATPQKLFQGVGVTLILEKPFTAGELLTAVRSALAVSPDGG
jgi:CheY-like chemotaxis protein